MAVSKFKFVSPGIQVAEIDNSRLPGVRAGTGPVIVGRTKRGPALRPVSIGSFSDFVEIFGNPIPGGGGGDVWRDGNNLAPTYAAYSAQAWLKNNNNITFVRLLGDQNPDATTTGQAGWIAGSLHDATLNTGGAFGLFVVNSGSTGAAVTGSLAAVFYLNQGSIELSGTARDGTQITGTAALVASQGPNYEFKALVKDNTGAITDSISFNFGQTSKKYIRSVFNTNPTLLNNAITSPSQLKKYFLGETYERFLTDTITGTAAGGQFAAIFLLQSGTVDQNDQRMAATPAQTGWFISQDLSSNTGSYSPANMTKLFRLVALDSGEWEMKNLKVSIDNVRISQNQDNKYGTFDVIIRRAQDTDNAPQVLERFTACSLNPNAPNYIAKKIGDKFVTWDYTNKKFRDFGTFDNASQFFRVVMNPDVDTGATNAEFLPFGFLGPVRFKGFNVISGAATPLAYGSTVTTFPQAFVEGNANIVDSKGTAGIFAYVGNVSGGLPFTGSFQFPAVATRADTRAGNLPNPQAAFFGIDTSRANSTRFENSYIDIVRKLPENLVDDPSSNPSLEFSFTFSLDDVSRLGSVDAQWAPGNRANGTSFTAVTGTYDAVLTAFFDGFTAPVVGGFDGLSIFEKEPFANRVLSGQSAQTSYAFHSLSRAIDSIADPEVVVANLLTAPGVTNTGITDKLVKVAEDRRDMLAIIDLEGGFLPSTENTNGDSSAQNRGDVDTTITNLRARAMNSSYGCAYYPWVQIRDTETGDLIWAPPSLAALGTFSSSEKKSELWFAPAGFTRGGLSQGAAGIPVTGVRQRLDSKERDKLYAANINPIGVFPAEGIVVMGQKTLQIAPSVVDRVNVRRLMNHIKVEISKVASTILFDQNLQTTWDRFTSKAEPILGSIKTRFGLEAFKVILDEKTTTPDLIDRNIVYAQVFIKPARAIEFIAIDFVITNSGASFAD